MSKKVDRPAYGFLLANAHTGTAPQLLNGVLAAAHQLNADLFCFPGGYLAAEGSSEAVRNQVYQLAAEAKLTGYLSWASAIGDFVDDAELERFHSQFAPQPLVCLVRPSGRAPLVRSDSYQGVYDAVAHLIRHHGHRRIAFVRGTIGHVAAEERLRAYHQALADHQIVADPALITSGGAWNNGLAALAELCDDRRLIPGRDIEAILAASDLLAHDVLRGLQDRGFVVPDEIAVVGVNDAAVSQASAPSLTTVHIGFEDQGGAGLLKLNSLAHGQAVPSTTSLPVRLVIRQSCGCPSFDVDLASSHLEAALPAASRFSDRIEACVQAIAGLLGSDLSTIDTHILPLVAAFADEVFGGGRPRFLRLLSSILEPNIRRGQGAESWHNALSILRREALRFLPAADRTALEDLVGMARVMIGSATQSGAALRQWKLDQERARIHAISRELLVGSSEKELITILAQRLPELGFGSSYLVRDQTLIFAQVDGRVSELPSGGLAVPSGVIIPQVVRPRRRQTLMVLGLCSRHRFLGYLVLEFSSQSTWLLEELQTCVAVVLEGIAAQARRDPRLAPRRTRSGRHWTDPLSIVAALGASPELPVQAPRLPLVWVDSTAILTQLARLPGLAAPLPDPPSIQLDLNPPWVALSWPALVAPALAVLAEMNEALAVAGARLAVVDAGGPWIFYCYLSLPGSPEWIDNPQVEDFGLLGSGRVWPAELVALIGRERGACRIVAPRQVATDGPWRALVVDGEGLNADDVVAAFEGRPWRASTLLLIYGMATTVAQDLFEIPDVSVESGSSGGEVSTLVGLCVSSPGLRGRLIQICHRYLIQPLILIRESPELFADETPGLNLLITANDHPAPASLPVLAFQGRIATVDPAVSPPHSLTVVPELLSDRELGSCLRRLVAGKASRGARRLVYQAITFMEQRYAEPFSRWQLADALNVSEDHLGRVFDEEMGMPMWDYLNRLRVERAARLLVESGLSIAEIASRTGFKDVSYFSRVFRRALAVSPNEFRRRPYRNYPI